MTDGSPGSDQGKTPRSPAGIKAESEYVKRFENLLNKQADILAEQRNSNEKSDSDYHEAYRQLIKPKDFKINWLGEIISGAGIVGFIYGFSEGLTTPVRTGHWVVGAIAYIAGICIKKRN